MKDDGTNLAYLLTGGNMGDRLAMLRRAESELTTHCGTVLQASAVYETEAWGKNDQPAFLNQVLQIKTLLNPFQLLAEVLKIEQSLGRIRAEKYGPRLVDIDILLYNEEVVQAPNLAIPHPHMAARRFVLAPLAEIAPNYMHPVLHTTVAFLLKQCNDPLQVHKL